jgi:hypothetical protein
MDFLNIDFFNIDINAIISFLTSAEIQEKLFPVKVAFLAISGLFLGVIIFVLLTSHYLQWLFFQDFWEFLTRRPFGAKRITRRWKKILRRLETETESEYKLAVIEADNILDSSLKRMGYAGQNLEERLAKLTSATLPNIEQIHQAHQTRNNIVHDPDYRLSLDEAKKTLDTYDQAFRALQILT